MKRTLKALLLVYAVFRYMPLWIILQIKLGFKDAEALMYKEDTSHFKSNFFVILRDHPYYKMLLYRRLGHISLPFQLLCGRYPLVVGNQYVMKLLGGGG